MTDAEHTTYWMGVKHQAERDIGHIAREPRPETKAEIIDYVALIRRHGTERDIIAADMAMAEWSQACNELHYKS